MRVHRLHKPTDHQVGAVGQLKVLRNNSSDPRLAGPDDDQIAGLKMIS